ncbi:MAG: hypothetical protein ACYS0I_16025 [Planctomycetota bacterium]|jgi:hypothetical protein
MEFKGTVTVTRVYTYALNDPIDADDWDKAFNELVEKWDSGDNGIFTEEKWEDYDWDYDIVETDFDIEEIDS